MNLDLNKYKLIKYIVDDKIAYVKNMYGNNIVLKKMSNHNEKNNFDKLSESQYFPQVIDDDKDYLHFEDLDIVSLKTYIENHNITSLIKFYDIALQLIDALIDLQSQNLIHKNLNYENIFYSEQEKKIYILDLEYASKIKTKVNINYSFDDFKGSIYFISPEQTGKINRSVDFRSDYYSLGAVFYYLLSSKLVFTSSSKNEIIYNHISTIAPKISSDNLEIPANLVLFIAKLLQKEPSQRYNSIEGIKKDLLSIITEETFNFAGSDYSNKLILKHNRYGRTEIINKLEYIFKKTIQSKIQFASIGGSSGVGKTTVVYELHKILSINNGFYAESKFTIKNSSIPYYAYLNILNNYFHTLFHKSKDEIEALKVKIKNALGDESIVLSNKIANLKILLNDEQKIENNDISEEEEKNRLFKLLCSLFKLILEKENSVIFFIDDTQWADSGSIDFTRHLIQSEGVNNLFIIAAYRNNEIDENHIYSKFISLIENQSNLHKFNIQELTKNDIDNIIEDTMNVKDDVLSDFFYKKSLGNAFYITQMIELFNHNNFFKYDIQENKFTYKIDELNSVGLTNDVVEIATKNIEKLDNDVLELLKYLSVISSSFHIDIINLMLSDTQNINELLIVAQERNYLIINENTYKFSHDKIQEAFYELIHINKIEEIHKEIANKLLSHYTLMQKYYGNVNLEISEHLSKAVKILNYDEKEKIVELNLDLAQEFKKSLAYDEAIKYLDMGISLLDKDDKNLYWSYLFNKLDVLYVTHKVEEINLIVDKLEDIVDSDQKHVELSKYMFTNNLYTIKYGANLLKKLKVKLPSEKNNISLLWEAQLFKRNIKKYEEDDILDFAEMDDEEMQLASKTLYNVILATYLTKDNLFYTYAFKMANISFKYGLNKYSSYAFALCSIYYTNVKHDFKKAKELIEFSYRLNEIYKDKECDSRIDFIKNNNLNHFFSDITKSYMNNYELNKKLTLSSQVYYSNYNEIINTIQTVFFSNKNFNELFDINSNSYKIFKNNNDNTLCKYQSHVVSFISTMQSYNDYKLLEKYDYNEEKFNIFLERKSNILGETLSYLLKAIKEYLFGDYEQANKYINIVSDDISTQLGNFNESVYMLFYNLIYLKQNTHTLQERYTYKKNINIIKIYVKQFPNNYSMFVNIMHASELATKNNNNEFDKVFNDALDDAIKQKNELFQALILELAGDAWFKISTKIANIYLYDSYLLYKKIFATNKANNLSQKYKISSLENLNIQNNETNDLDLDSIVLATQTLSQEIKVKEILQSMINIILKNVGANKGYVILNQGDNTQLVVASVDNDVSDLLSNKLVSDEENISSSVINYVNASNKTLIIDEAYLMDEYKNDTYIQDNKIKSILALPIIQNDVQKGILYCENNLISGVFSNSLLKTLSILLSQLIISLDNAYLYENLEHIVENRTSELNLINDKVKSSIKYASLIQKSLLTPKSFLNKFFIDSFLIWEPRDIVGGDMYIMEKLHTPDECIIIIIDCTGHGVPGAFVTMLVKAIEKKVMTNILKDNIELSSAYIMKEFNKEILNIWNTEDNEKRAIAGFDGGAIYYNKKTKIIKFSGARTPLFYMKDGTLNTIKGNRQSIGYDKEKIDYDFDENIIEVEDNMHFYLTTDGYIDQLGGEKNFTYGTARLKKSIISNYKKPFSEQEIIYKKNLNDYQGHFERVDDITFLAFKT